MPVTGDRVMLFAAGVLALLVGIVAYRQMDDRRPVPLLADVVTALRRDTTARRRLARGGVLIAFEGGEGAGKSTQVRRLQEWLTSEGLVARATFEPGATQAGAGIRAIVLDRGQTGMSPRAEALLYAVDRAQWARDRAGAEREQLPRVLDRILHGGAPFVHQRNPVPQRSGPGDRERDRLGPGGRRAGARRSGADVARPSWRSGW